MSALEVWDCRKFHSIRNAPCGSGCLPGDDVSRESTRPLTAHGAARHAWVAWAESAGYRREDIDAMTTNELITAWSNREVA